jgi:hypothetical protein
VWVMLSRNIHKAPLRLIIAGIVLIGIFISRRSE